MKRFEQTLERIDRMLAHMTNRVDLIRSLYENGSMEPCYVQTLRLEENAERLTLQARSLPVYTGARSAPDDVEQTIHDVIPVEMGFTEEGWFCLRIPMLLPKKESGSVDWLRGFLYPAMSRFFMGKQPVRYPDCVLIYRHVYARDWTTTRRCADITTAPPQATRNGQRSMWCPGTNSFAGWNPRKASRKTVKFSMKSAPIRLKNICKNTPKNGLSKSVSPESREPAVFLGFWLFGQGFFSRSEQSSRLNPSNKEVRWNDLFSTGQSASSAHHDAGSHRRFPCVLAPPVREPPLHAGPDHAADRRAGLPQYGNR